MASLPITLTTDAGSSVQSLPTNGATPHQPAPAAPATEWGYVNEEGRLVISPEMQRVLGWQQRCLRLHRVRHADRRLEWRGRPLLAAAAHSWQLSAPQGSCFTSAYHWQRVQTQPA